MKFRIAILLIIFSFSPILSGAQDLSKWVSQVKLPTPDLEKLPNGMTIAWFVDDRIPLVDLALLVRSGFINDPKGRSGTSYLLSLVLDRGADDLTYEEISKKIESLGASRYLSANEESFTIGMHGLSGDAPTLLELLSKIAIKPSLPPNDFEKEKKRSLDRWKHLGDNSSSLASLAFSRWINSGTRYGRGNFKNLKELKKIERKDLLRFHQNYFRPDRSVLMIVGKVNRIEFKKKIVKYFGIWKGKTAKTKLVRYRHSKLKLTKKEKGILVNRKGLSQARIFMGFESPLYTHPDHYALLVGNALFGEYFNSRLNSVIRDKLALTYSIASSFSYQKEHAAFVISSSTRNSEVGKLVKEVKKLTKKWIEGPISKKEVEEAKTYLLGQFPIRTGTLYSIASRWLGGFIFGLGSNYLNEFIPRVSKVSPKNVQNALRKHFKGKTFKIVISGSAPEVQKSLVKSKQGRYKIIKQADLI